MTFSRRISFLVVGGVVALTLGLGGTAGADSAVRQPTSVNIAVGAHGGGALSALAADDDVFYRIVSAGRGVDKVRFTAKFTQLEPNADQLTVAYSVSSTVPCSGTIEMFNYDTGTWQVVTSNQNVTTSETDFELPLAGGPFVNNSGVAKLRGTCTTDAGDFTLRIDRLTAQTTSAP